MKEKHEKRSRRRSNSSDRHHYYKHHHHHHCRREKNGKNEVWSSDEEIRETRKRHHGDDKKSYNRGKRRSVEKTELERDLSHSPPRRKIFKDKEIKEEKWGKGDEVEEKKIVENKAKPDFGLSGKLAEEVNTFNGVVIKYSEPPEARKPKRRWRLYPFKGEEVLPTLYIHRQSAYLIGRDRKVADLPIDHPSCSKQHAVLQYRIVPYIRADGTKARRIRPYIIDLESANGTYINNNKIEAKKYVELMERDVIKFAYSSREYVLLHEHSQGDGAEEDDNVEVV